MSNNREDRLVQQEIERLKAKEKKKTNKTRKKSEPINNKTQTSANRMTEAKSKESDKENRQIYKSTIFFAVIFFCMIGYYMFYVTAYKNDVINNSYNSRVESYAETVVRGSIYTKNGKVIAYTETDEFGEEKRVYPYDEMFAHAVGINDFGKTGIEKQYNYDLLTTNTNQIIQIINEFKGEKNIGNDIVTTLNFKLQEAAYNSLGNYDGAVVVLDNDTGEILAMVSKPDYNPNNYDEIKEELDKESKKSFLLNRASQGLYTPGSIFKVFTLLEYIREDGDIESFKYNCKGTTNLGNFAINCYNKTWHGHENLKEAFAYSCNGAFTEIGKNLNINKFYNNLEKMLFNKKLPLNIEYSKSVFSLTNEDSLFDITQTAIGQGKTLVSPIHMAMITQAICNKGEMLKPYIVSEINGNDGSVLQKNVPTTYAKIMSEDEAKIIKEYMSDVADYGTGKILSSKKYKVGGKTGTAELDANNNVNSWFIGYASKGDKNISVSIVIENVEDGNIKAVECAEEIFDAYFK